MNPHFKTSFETSFTLYHALNPKKNELKTKKSHNADNESCNRPPLYPPFFLYCTLCTGMSVSATLWLCAEPKGASQGRRRWFPGSKGVTRGTFPSPFPGLSPDFSRTFPRLSQEFCPSFGEVPGGGADNF